MIPIETAALADALADEFNLDFDEAVRRACRVQEMLGRGGFDIKEKDSA